MSRSLYTLLIVESPTLAKIIQHKAPSSVYVLATGGFCWRPVYDPQKQTLKAIADPEKVNLRKELKEQAAWAGNIIIATDSDPSGDFIAWSISKFLKSSFLKRSQIRRLSKSGILSTISETTNLDPESLELRLKNRFLIHHEWNNIKSIPPFQTAVLASLFSSSNSFTHFLDNKGVEYRSSQPIQANLDEWLPVRQDRSLDEYRIQKPLSTFDVIEQTIKHGITSQFTEAQLLLQQLFQTTLLHSDQSLISYPRTVANAFYSETWDLLRNQKLSFTGQNDLKPTFLEEVADSNEPHESIHPLHLNLVPDQVSGELPKKIGQIYTLIYNSTSEAITLPQPVKISLVSDFYPDAAFYSVDDTNQAVPESLRPFFTIADIGKQLNKIGGISASSFGKQMDDWIKTGFLNIHSGRVTAGKQLAPLLNKSDRFFRILNELKILSTQSDLNPETVRGIITS